MDKVLNIYQVSSLLEYQAITKTREWWLMFNLGCRRRGVRWRGTRSRGGWQVEDRRKGRRGEEMLEQRKWGVSSQQQASMGNFVKHFQCLVCERVANNNWFSNLGKEVLICCYYRCFWTFIFRFSVTSIRCQRRPLWLSCSCRSFNWGGEHSLAENAFSYKTKKCLHPNAKSKVAFTRLRRGTGGQSCGTSRYTRQKWSMHFLRRTSLSMHPRLGAVSPSSWRKDSILLEWT